MSKPAVDVVDELIEARKTIQSQKEQIEILQIDAENYKPTIARYEQEVMRLQAELKEKRSYTIEMDELKNKLRTSERVIEVLRSIILDMAARRPNDDYI